MLEDFNEVMWQSEHFPRRKRGEKQMAEFREMLCNLFDLGYSGLPWPYDHKQEGPKNVRLDRVVACPD
jgi:hypothetical protein